MHNPFLGDYKKLLSPFDARIDDRIARASLRNVWLPIARVQSGLMGGAGSPN